MPREPIPTWFFALVIVRLKDRFLLVQENDGSWYVPAGRVEPGEDMLAAARRETFEESGVPVTIDGIVRVEHTPLVNGARVRIVFTAHPLDETPPKSTPDAETLRAAWVSLRDLDRYPLRGAEVRDMLAYVAQGGPVYSLSLLTYEGTPFVIP